MRNTSFISTRFFCICVLAATTALPYAHQVNAQNQKPKKKQQPFQWVNELKVKLPGVQHATFHSPSMNVDVGYCIYLPPQYHAAGNEQ